MRKRLLLLLPVALLFGAPAAPDPWRVAVDRSQSEFRSAQAEAARLEKAAEQASGELDRLRARQRAAAGRIDAAEAQITLAGLRLAQAQGAARAERLALARAQQPVASLLAGVAMMGERPPLLALVDQGSVDGLVETRVLLDATLPVIRARSQALAGRLGAAERAVERARTAQLDLRASRAALEQGQRDFAALEQQLLQRTTRAGVAAVEASDRVLASGEASERALTELRSSRAIRVQALEFARSAPIPARPGVAQSGPVAPFAYRLPVAAPVTQGLGDVDRSGIRARGLTLATARGAPLEAPGAGVIRFAGPFRGFDGVLIIDHGGGWLTMLVNMSPQVRRGQRVAAGDPVGRALGPISVELYRNGKAYSPALIAGSSAALSKARAGG